MGRAEQRWRAAAGDGLSRASGEGAVRGAALALCASGIVVSAVAGLVVVIGLHPTLGILHAGLFTLFLVIAAARLALPTLTAALPPASALPGDLPRYTVIVPLRDEAIMAGQIIANMERLNYPPDRLQVLFVIEDDDADTHAALLAALLAAGPSEHMHILVAPPGGPATKPRACNLALSQAQGDLVVVYDAEDQPDRLQLMEAAARFAQAPPRLGCLQAPLRVVERRSLLQRQFALEYAALFEVVLPGLAALRLPFPLGGTSNHFRREALDAVGGWDAFNVTEDADIGFRLALHGWEVGLLQAPTWEEAPTGLHTWMPQRARWLKGYIQTWSAAMRRPLGGGLRRFLAMQASLGLVIVSSLAHGPLILLTAASAVVALIELKATPMMAVDALLLLFAWASAVTLMAAGARRAGLHMTFRDALGVVGYWPVQSLAAAHALQQLVTAPFQWDKTTHHPSTPVMDLAPPSVRALALDGAALNGVALDGDAKGSLTRAA